LGEGIERREGGRRRKRGGSRRRRVKRRRAHVCLISVSLSVSIGGERRVHIRVSLCVSLSFSLSAAGDKRAKTRHMCSGSLFTLSLFTPSLSLSLHLLHIHGSKDIFSCCLFLFLSPSLSFLTLEPRGKRRREGGTGGEEG